MKFRVAIVIAFAVLAGGCAHSGIPTAQSNGCMKLVGLRLDVGGAVEKAQWVSAGQTISVSGVKTKPRAPVGFCRVLARLTPVAGSEIRSEFWLPDPAAWNRKFLGVGNGGFGGDLPGAMLLEPLRQGYAGGGSDMGHVGNVLFAKWAYHDPVKLMDWAQRANHVTALAGKQLIAVYYGEAPKESYFHGCSDGGREALMEARRYPDDYNGIIAGAPAADFTGVMAQFAWNHRAVAGVGLGSAKLKLISDAVLARCDAADGVEDGLIEDPQRCQFDPAELECKSGDGDDCLTPAQVNAVRAIYQGPRTQGGTQISSGFSVGGEAIPWGWNVWITGAPIIGSGQSVMATQFYRWMVFGDKHWTLSRFNLDSDWAISRARLASLIDSDDPDLHAFVGRGGKLILYHGWSDAALAPENTVRYYEAVRNAVGEAADHDVRLFMVPGMLHCTGGPGPNVFDALGALDKWVQGGAPPERLIATKYDDDMAGLLGEPAKVLRTRPLCAWPRVARWVGKGSPDVAASFACVSPK